MTPAKRRFAAWRGMQAMILTRLRLIGFKSSSSRPISRSEPGLTGVVGPERLRQVQSGGGVALGDGRGVAQGDARRSAWTTSFSPATPIALGRNAAGSRDDDRQHLAHRAAQFNGEDTLEVSRRIEREGRLDLPASTAPRGCGRATSRSCLPTPRPVARSHGAGATRAASARSSRAKPRAAPPGAGRGGRHLRPARTAPRGGACGCAPPSRT